MRICAYVQGGYAKPAYKNENFNTRQWVGLSVIVDSLRRAGYEVEYAGAATVHEYDWVLVSITSDCDWWSFIAERVQWQAGSYKVIVGGAGVLNVRPFLPYADYFSLGRGETTVPALIGGEMLDDSIIDSRTFSPDAIYHIRQEMCYGEDVTLTNGRTFRETSQGCPHKCLFCGYTWQRRYSGHGEFEAGSGLWSGEETVRERAILDMRASGNYDFGHLRITSIDGFSERLRRSVNKPITRDMRQAVLHAVAEHQPPHQLKLSNLVGLPGERDDDWMEFLDDVRLADTLPAQAKQWMLVVHSTPFRPMPATPLACAPASYRNYRGEVARVLSGGRASNSVFYRGARLCALEGMGTDSLATHALSMICHRGVEDDTDNVRKVATSKRFWRASAAVKIATLERYFDMARLFGAYDAKDLPTRYLRTYCQVEKMWR